jgi:hypothetical protein
VLKWAGRHDFPYCGSVPAIQPTDSNNLCQDVPASLGGPGGNLQEITSQQKKFVEFVGFHLYIAK